MTRQSTIAHLNVAGFHVQVLESIRPDLQNVPFVIVTMESPSAIVIDASKHARRKGVAPGMSLSQCERIYPGILSIPPNDRECILTDERMACIASRHAPVVQEDTGGHLFLDLSGTERLWGVPSACALAIKSEIRKELNLDAILSIAPNKLVAKVLSRMIAPSGFINVMPDAAEISIAEGDINLLPGVSPSAEKALSAAGIFRIGEIARLQTEEALALAGPRGRELQAAARGIDNSPVRPGKLVDRHIRNLVVFPIPLSETAALRAALLFAAENTGTDLRKSGLSCLSVQIFIEYADGARHNATMRPLKPIRLDGDIYAEAESAFEKARTRRVRIKSLDLVLSDLVPSTRQGDLFLPCKPSREDWIQKAVDKTRQKHGHKAITRGVSLQGKGIYAR